MSEDEALKVINKRTEELLEEFKIEKEAELEDEPRIAYLMQQIRANKTILDLYNKEKEKNKELYKDNQKQWAERCRLSIELDNNTISKDKIKEKIESIENTFEVCDEEINYKLKIEDKAKIDVLRELLD